ncbi:hypothetical protein VM95_31550 [Streptomyces rubellomurinus]|uniref:Uncharacterized protein n=1 Tax=Streptomyces rubellomurinus (strain ATCC 31215) TaxID=359131 RepID=A0A0F2T689_STRR3|nr:hypothetical protein VM95_31550 [Streptomyces rubellomurinus]
MGQLERKTFNIPMVSVDASQARQILVLGHSGVQFVDFTAEILEIGPDCLHLLLKLLDGLLSLTAPSEVVHALNNFQALGHVFTKWNCARDCFE